jgi:hypothetical protein
MSDKKDSVFSFSRDFLLQKKSPKVVGSNPASPILFIPFSVELTLFTELNVENWIIKCFKWFANVLLRLKPSSSNFSTRALSRYNTTLCFVAIVFASEGLRGKFPCYKCGHFSNN